MSSDSEPEVQTFVDAKIKAKEMFRGVPGGKHKTKTYVQKVAKAQKKSNISEEVSNKKAPALKVAYLDDKIKNLMNEELPTLKVKAAGQKLNNIRSKKIKKETKRVIIEKPVQKACKILSQNMQVIFSMPKKLSATNINPQLLEFKDKLLKRGDPRRMPLRKIITK